MSAFLEGWRRVLRAPAVTSGLLVGTLLMTGAAVMTLGGTVGGVQLPGLRWIFAHEVFGFGGVLIIPTAIAGSGFSGSTFWLLSINVVFWMFVSGGALDRLARDRPTRTASFFAVSGVHFFHFLRLGALMAVPWWLLLSWTGVASQRSVTLTVVAVLALTIWTAIGDYAKVRIVVEDRHSAIGALAGAVRFLARHPLQTFALYLLNAIVMFLAIAFNTRLLVGRVPSAWLAAAVYTVSLLLQILARLSFMASSVALFQSKLAHAGYVAAPLPMWPDSPSAEALQNLVDRKKS